MARRTELREARLHIASRGVGDGERVPCATLGDAHRLLGRVRSGAAAIAELRRVLQSTAALDVSRMTDAEVLGQLAIRMVRGEVRVFVRPRHDITGRLPERDKTAFDDVLGPQSVEDEVFRFVTDADHVEVFAFDTEAQGLANGEGGEAEAAEGEEAAGGASDDAGEDAPLAFDTSAAAEPLVFDTDASVVDPLRFDTDASAEAAGDEAKEQSGEQSEESA